LQKFSIVVLYEHPLMVFTLDSPEPQHRWWHAFTLCWYAVVLTEDWRRWHIVFCFVVTSTRQYLLLLTAGV